MNNNYNRKSDEEFKRPNFLFRAVTIFLVVTLVIIIIFLIDAANEKKKEIALLQAERKELENEVEELQKHNEDLEKLESILNSNTDSTNQNREIDEAMRKAAKELGYYDGDAQQYVFPVPNSDKETGN